MTENKNKDIFWTALSVTLFLYSIGVVVCCITLYMTMTKDLSINALKELLWLNIALFLIPIAPNVLCAMIAFGIAITDKIINKITHYVDVFHYYEELKADEDKKHLLYNNKSKTKP